MLTYRETTLLLDTLAKNPIHKLGLEAMQENMSRLSLSTLPFPTIHIAGTNGKGSVSHKIASSLTKAGYKVGLYTSPHIASYCERIQVNQKPIPEPIFAKHMQTILETKMNAFEALTLTAFLYFAKEQVDYGVIEVGLGGRLDATNVILPLLSVITSISLDHQAILGETKEAIAKEKAGIMKPQVPCILGPSVERRWVEAIAQEKSAPLHSIEGIFSTYDEENKAIARRALEVLGQKAYDLEAKPPCRLQTFHVGEKIVTFDVAHNEAGIEALFRSYKTTPLVLCSFSKQKPLAPLLANLRERTGCLICVDLQTPWTHSYEEILPHLLPQERLFHSIDEAVAFALEEKERSILITGSHYLMQPSLEALNKNMNLQLSF